MQPQDTFARAFALKVVNESASNDIPDTEPDVALHPQ